MLHRTDWSLATV